jgi:drug/metabolite transporter (DMT)-like permease
MNWVFYALIAWLFTGTSFLLLKNVSSKVQSNLSLQYIYILMAFIIAGIFSGLILIYLKLTNNKFLKDISSFSKTNLISLGVVLVLSYLFLMVAGNKGGTPAFQIINLNIIIAAIGGYLFYNEKLNLTKIIGIIVAIVGASIIITG